LPEGHENQRRKKTSAEVTEGLRAAALSKAASAGGDVVRFAREGAVDTAEVPTGKMEKVCEDSQQVSVSQFVSEPCYSDGTGLHCPPGHSETKYVSKCVRWGSHEKMKWVESLVSEGTVWRYDPKWVADIARAEEVAREAAREESRKADAAREATRKVEALYKDFKELEERLYKGQYAEAELLLAQGADVNVRDQYGRTLLSVLGAIGAPRKSVELLLVHGADVNAKDKDGGDTPLHEAANFKHKELAELFLAHGADVNAEDDRGDTPLHDVAQFGEKEMAEFLLAHGADINAKNKHGETPLHSTTGQGNREVAEVLLAHGADVNAKSSLGNTPLHYAATFGKKELVELLRQHGGHE